MNLHPTDREELRQEAMGDLAASFTTDATDEVIGDDGNWHWLLGMDNSGKLEAAFLAAVMDSDASNVMARVIALREQLRADAAVVLAEAIKTTAEKMAEAHVAELVEAA